MIPRTYPSRVNSTTGRVEALVSFISSTTGLQRWVDYTPVAFVTDATPVEGSYDNDGYIAVADVGSTPGLQAGKDYIRVYLDPNATDAWRVNSVGFIPVGYSGIGGIPYALFANNEQGVWYDPSDFDRYMAPLGPELVTNGDFSSGTTGWTARAGCTLSAVGGWLRLTYTGSGAARANFTTLTTVAGRTYKVLFAVRNTTSTTTAGFFAYADAFATLIGTSGSKTADGSYEMVFTAISTITNIEVGNSASNGGVGAYLEFDNISVRELTAIDTATLFQDSAGTTPVTAVEQPVGLMLDKSKGLVLGSELVASGNFTGWTTQTGWTISGGTATATSLSGGNAVLQNVGLVANATYEITVTCSSISGGSWYVRCGFDTISGNISAAGTYKFRMLRGSNAFVYIVGNAGLTASFTTVSVRELPGNHAFQTTSTSRPVLSARYNQITGSDGFVGATITPGTGLVVVATGLQDPRGGFTARQIRNTTTTELHRLYLGVSSAGRNTYSVEVKDVDAGFVQLSMAGTVVAATGATFNLSTKTFTLVGLGQPTASVETLANGFLRLTITAPATETQTNNVQLHVLESDANTVNPSTTGTGKSVIVAGADLRVTNDAAGQPAYQRVNTATDYDTTGFKPYLRFDGTDDGLQTNSINFTATDKMTVFAGVRKLSDATIGALVELSAISDTNSGSFDILAPHTGENAAYRFLSKGTIASRATATPISSAAAPITNVVTGIGDIAGDSAILRVNGTQAASSTADQGTGNYGNYPLYIGRRGGTTLPFNGRIYGLIVRGAATTTATIQATETYMNGKTGAY